MAREQGKPEKEEITKDDMTMNARVPSLQGLPLQGSFLMRSGLRPLKPWTCQASLHTQLHRVQECTRVWHLVRPSVRLEVFTPRTYLWMHHLASEPVV